MSLVQELIELIDLTGTKMSDYDQRSALGIADSYVRGSANIDTPQAAYDDEGPVNRDGLAAALIEALGNIDKEECREALREARRHLNAPFANDPAILRWREQRHARFPEGIGTAEK